MFGEHFPGINPLLMGESNYNYNIIVGTGLIDIGNMLKIVEVGLEIYLNFKLHFNEMVKEVYIKIGALQRSQHWKQLDISVRLYKVCYT